MKLKLKNLKNKIFEIDIEDSETILSLKQKTEEIHGINHLTIKLIYNQQILEDEKRISDFGIPNEGVVVMMNCVAKPKNIAKPVKDVKEKELEIEESKQEEPVKEKRVKEDNEDEENYNLQLAKKLSGDKEFISDIPIESNLGAFDNEISEFLNMGFDYEKIVKALSYSNGNFSLSLDYLTNDNIPKENPNLFKMTVPDNLKEPPEQMKKYASIFKVVLESDESKLESILGFLEKQDPRLYFLINENQNMFQRLIRKKINEQDLAIFVAFISEFPEQNPFTPEEMDSINRIRSYGFNDVDIFHAFFDNKKNEELAVNYLIDYKTTLEQKDSITSELEKAILMSNQDSCLELKPEETKPCEDGLQQTNSESVTTNTAEVQDVEPSKTEDKNVDEGKNEEQK